MKKKWILIGVAAVVVAALLVGGLLYYKHMQNRPGVHMFDGTLYVNLQGTGFTFDVETGEIIGETPVTAQGSAKVDKSFDGDLNVLGYSLSETGTITHNSTLMDVGNGFYEIHYSPSCQHTETVDVTDEEGKVTGTKTEQKDHLCNYQYIYVVCPENPDFLAVYINDYAETDYYCSVLADSEAEAKDLYKWLRDKGL